MELQQRVKEIIRDIPDFPKPGIIFKDITTIFLNAELVKDIADHFAERAKLLGVTAVAAIDSRGFLFGPMIAQQLNVPFLMVRKKGKLPGPTFESSYELEYGSATVEMHKNDLPKGSKVLIHDDLLATGGTAAAAAKLVEMAESEVAGFSFIIELDFLNGKEKLNAFSESVESLVHY